MSKVNKSAATGRFVSNKQVQSNPKTTYQQTVKDCKSTPKKSR